MKKPLFSKGFLLFSSPTYTPTGNTAPPSKTAADLGGANTTTSTIRSENNPMEQGEAPLLHKVKQQPTKVKYRRLFL